MKCRVLFALVAVSMACSRPSPVPSNQTAHDAHAPSPPAAARTALFGNLGAYHREIKTTNREAQQFFDEGLTLLYGFNHEESFKSFELAAARDAAAPMPHWGMALALGTNINDIAPAERLKQGYAHLAEARKRKSAGSEVEQGLIDALAKRYVADASGDQMVREKAYSDAMGALASFIAAGLLAAMGAGLVTEAQARAPHCPPPMPFSGWTCQDGVGLQIGLGAAALTVSGLATLTSFGFTLAVFAKRHGELESREEESSAPAASQPVEREPPEMKTPSRMP